MTTATDEQALTEAAEAAFKQGVDDYEKGALEVSEGEFKVTLLGNHGKGVSSGGAYFLNTRFKVSEEALYDPETGIHTGETREIKRYISFFQKFYVTKGEAKGGGPNDYGIKHLNSWFRAVDYDTKGEFNPQTEKYEFDRDEALSATIDRSAWVSIRHKKDEGYGWQIELGDFSKKPRYRIKVTNGG